MERGTSFDMSFGVTHVATCTHTHTQLLHGVVSGKLQGCRDKIGAQADRKQAAASV